MILEEKMRREDLLRKQREEVFKKTEEERKTKIEELKIIKKKKDEQFVFYQVTKHKNRGKI